MSALASCGQASMAGHVYLPPNLSCKAWYRATKLAETAGRDKVGIFRGSKRLVGSKRQKPLVGQHIITLCAVETTHVTLFWLGPIWTLQGVQWLLVYLVILQVVFYNKAKLNNKINFVHTWIFFLLLCNMILVTSSLFAFVTCLNTILL